MKKILISLLVIMFSFTLVGCGKTEAIDTVTFDTTSLSATYEVDALILSQLKLIVQFENGKYKHVSVTEDMISSSDLDMLSTIGTHTIEIIYEGVKLPVTLTIIDSGSSGDDYVISFDTTSLLDLYEVNTVDVTELRLLIVFTDKTTFRVAVTENMISSSDLSSLDTIGSHTIDITYEGTTVSITMNVVVEIIIIEPTITNPDGIFLSAGEVDVTNQELWERMKITDGLYYLEKYIEENFLFVTEIAAVTQTEIDSKIEFYKYGTNNADDIAIILKDQDLVDNFLKQFESNLAMIGYDSTNADDQRSFAEIEVAKDNVVRNYIDTASTTDSLYMSNEDIETYYNTTTHGDVSAINIIFSSAAEAADVFANFNLVPNYNLGWGLYTGLDYNAQAIGTFDETNTVSLDDAAVLTKFIEMYNYMNPNETPISPTATELTFTTLTGDVFNYNYNTMTESRTVSDAYVDLADYMFFTLNLVDDYARYSFMLQEFGDFQILTYKVDQDEVIAFDSLDSTAVTATRELLLDSKITDSNYALVISSIWADADYELFDPAFKLQNAFTGNEVFDNSNDTVKVATINGTDITADTLFNYMKHSVGVFYAIEITELKLLLSSDAYTELYEDDYDFMNSTLPILVSHQNDLKGMKASFNSDSYATYGFSNTIYTWSEFLTLAVGAKTEADVIRDAFVFPTISPYFTKDSIDYSSALDIVQTKADEYFSLNVKHLLIYVDADRDLSPDRYDAYLENLEGADITAYNALTVSLNSLIMSKIADGYTFDTMVTEFNDGIIDDIENDWAIYKAYGFHIMTQDLSTTTSLDPSTTQYYDNSFVDAVKDLYDEYVVLDNMTSTEVTQMYDNELITTDFGLHFLYATKGTDFYIPSAIYTETDDVDSVFAETANNDTIIPSLNQVKMYIEIEFATLTHNSTDVSLPTSVYDAVAYYFGSTYNAYFTSTGYSIESINYMLDNNVTFSVDSALSVSYLEAILEILYNNNFPEGYIIIE